MNEWDSMLRLIFFLGGFLIFWGAGVLFPFRPHVSSDPFRWLNNVGLTLFNSLIVKVISPLSLMWLADSLERQNLGLFYFIQLPTAFSVLSGIVLLDGMIYFQHVLFHKFPALWRLHQVHHSDTGFDATTALRFHPIEILISLVIKAMAIALLGVPPLAVIVFEILLNFSALFNHGNFSLPSVLEKTLRLLVVTPDMHRIHHSVSKEETDSNYGFFISFWDRLFQTYRKESKHNLKLDFIGVEKFRQLSDQRLDRLLFQPFKRD